MTMTDKIIFFAAIILFWRGWNKGILRTVFGPIALIVCSILSYLYYIWTRDMLTAAAIGIAAPILLNIIFSILLNLLSPGKDKDRLAIFSRVTAGLLNLIWGEFILLVTILTVLMIPFDLPSLNKAQEDIKTSSVYSFAKPALDEALKTHNVKPIDPSKIAALSDPKKMATLEKSEEFKTLIADERVQQIINDPEISELIKKKQIPQLMQHPKILELTRDPELLKKFLALYSKMLN
jgi:uncharacterized membrane protein required for colicin V production